MNIAFIGAGKVGRSFGYYLKTKGFNIVGYMSKSRESEEIAANETGSSPLTKEEVLKKAEIIIITTPDTEIEKVCDDVSKSVGFDKDHLVVHMSGGLSSKILSSAREQGASIFSLHPLQSFAKVEKAREELKNTFFAMEGEGDKEKLVSILDKIQNPYVEIDSEKKSLYHGAAAIASNYLVALTNVVLKLLQDCGFNRADALKVTGNLMQGTLNNVKEYDTVEALTGPIVRGDVNMVQHHLDELKKHNYDRILEIYRLLGEETVEIACSRGLSSDKAARLIESLKGQDNL